LNRRSKRRIINQRKLAAGSWWPTPKLRPDSPKLLKPLFYPGLFPLPCSTFLHCRAFNQGKEGKPSSLARISYGAQELAVFLLADSPPILPEIPVREKTNCSFPQNNTGEANEERR
jgi:hypothetical protein